jgi:hypothetical protein
MNIQFNRLHFSWWNASIDAVSALKKRRVVVAAVSEGGQLSSRASFVVISAPRGLDTATLINKVLTKIAALYAGMNVSLSVDGNALVLDEKAMLAKRKAEVPAPKKVAPKKVAAKRTAKTKDERVASAPVKKTRKAKQQEDEPPVH